MKVKDLKELLTNVPDDTLVVLSRDSEGNNYSPLDDFSHQTYVPDSEWSGEIYLQELTEEFKDIGYTDEDMYHGNNGVKAIVMWPIN